MVPVPVATWVIPMFTMGMTTWTWVAALYEVFPAWLKSTLQVPVVEVQVIVPLERVQPVLDRPA